MPKTRSLSDAVMDSLTQAIAVLDRDGQVIETNEAWRRLDTLNGNDTAGAAAQGENYVESWQRHREKIPEAPDVLAALERALNGATSRTRTLYRCSTPSGVRHLVVGLAPLHCPPGEVLVSREDVTEQHWSATKIRTLLGVDVDITELHRPSEIITKVLGELRVSLEGDTAACFLWEETDQLYRPAALLGFTPEQEDLIRTAGYGRGQLFGSIIERGQALVLHDLAEQHWLPPEGYESLSIHQLVVAPIATDNRHHGVLTVAHTRREAPFQTDHVELCQAVGRRLAYAIENAQLIEELGRASSLKSEFVAMMSHELRTPLHVVLGYTSLLLDQAFGPLNDDQRDSLQRINHSGSTLLELINETLNLSQLDAGRVPLNLEEIDLTKLFTRVASQGAVPVAQGEVAYEMDLADDLPLITSDRSKVEVVVRNLLSNAFKFTLHGRVTLRARAVTDGVEFSVSDTGEGIPPEKQVLVFEPFRQGSESLTRRVGGAGLGLHLVRRYLDLLGGQIRLESEVGTGSSFTVNLPLAAKVPPHQDDGERP